MKTNYYSDHPLLNSPLNDDLRQIGRLKNGGCCGDCIYNVFLGSMAVCAQDISLHKKERCRFYHVASLQIGSGCSCQSNIVICGKPSTDSDI